MQFYQKDANAIFYTNEKLHCDHCKKQFEKILDVKNEGKFCFECLKDLMPSILGFSSSLQIRMLIDTLFNIRKEQKKKERNKLTLKLRFSILKRDKFKCVKCGGGPENNTLEIDHIIPVCEGGKTIESNLQTLCFNCNRGKGGIYD